MQFQCAIIGGGLGGLTLAIQLAQKGYRVVLFEKENYPYHKVCGEYVSMESWNYLERCGVPLTTFNLPKLTQLKNISTQWTIFNTYVKAGRFWCIALQIRCFLSTTGSRKWCKSN